MSLSEETRRRTLWRAHHRGTKEADMLVGGFADRWLDSMDAGQLRWFEIILDEQDVDIMAWAMGTAAPPLHLDGEMMQRLRALDYIRLIPR